MRLALASNTRSDVSVRTSLDPPHVVLACARTRVVLSAAADCTRRVMRETNDFEPPSTCQPPREGRGLRRVAGGRHSSGW